MTLLDNNIIAGLGYALEYCWLRDAVNSGVATRALLMRRVNTSQRDNIQLHLILS